MELFAKCIAKTKYHPVSGGVGILSVLKWGKYKSGVIKTQKNSCQWPSSAGYFVPLFKICIIISWGLAELTNVAFLFMLINFK